MDYRRLILYFALAFVAFSLWTAWLKDYPSAPSAPAAVEAPQQQVVPSVSSQAPNVPVPPQTPQATAAAAPVLSQTPTERVVDVKTDVLDVKIDTLGGDIVQVALPNYPAEVRTPHVPVTLLNDSPETFYVAQSGVTGPQGPDVPQGQVQYKAEQTSYTLPEGKDQLDVKLTWQNKQGLTLSKIFRFTRGRYAIHVDYDIQNNSSKPWSGNVYAQIKRREPPSAGGLFRFSTFTGAAISSPEKPYQKISFSKMNDTNLSQNIRGGWLAMQQRYFVSVWIPNQQQTNYFFTRANPDKIFTIGFVGPTVTVAPKSHFSTTTTFFAGPALEDQLKGLAPHLELIIDFGWLWWLAIPILWVMERIYRVVGNWGWSIVLVTILIKAIFYKLSEISYRSMAKMRQLQPKMEQLKQRYGDDRAKLSQATMELYRKEKVNPLGGCLPIIVQIPVFIALYYVLIESVQLRHAPFILWIHDLSARDPYFILPILMGLSMYFQQRLNPAPPDPVQARVMQLMPLIFTIFFLTFPAGLVLYWLTNNVLSILQQWHIMRRIETKIESKFEKRTKTKTDKIK
jgi:YidC/Oxa1 family membrane protein insertase